MQVAQVERGDGGVEEVVEEGFGEGWWCVCVVWIMVHAGIVACGVRGTRGSLGIARILRTRPVSARGFFGFGGCEEGYAEVAESAEGAERRRRGHLVGEEEKAMQEPGTAPAWHPASGEVLPAWWVRPCCHLPRWGGEGAEEPRCAALRRVRAPPLLVRPWRGGF